jgi:hypothetical protein
VSRDKPRGCRPDLTAALRSAARTSIPKEAPQCRPFLSALGGTSDKHRRAVHRLNGDLTRPCGTPPTAREGFPRCFVVSVDLTPRRDCASNANSLPRLCRLPPPSGGTGGGGTSVALPRDCKPALHGRGSSCRARVFFRRFSIRKHDYENTELRSRDGAAAESLSVVFRLG